MVIHMANIILHLLYSPINSTRSSTNISRGSIQEVSDGTDLYETQMNPDYSSPARSKWIDAVNRVREKLQEVCIPSRSLFYVLLTSMKQSILIFHPLF